MNVSNSLHPESVYKASEWSEATSTASTLTLGIHPALSVLISRNLQPVQTPKLPVLSAAAYTAFDKQNVNCQ